jgi:hypothetical protein
MKTVPVSSSSILFATWSFLFLSGFLIETRAERGSLKLDGNSHASAADHADLGMGSNSFTMEAWIKHDGNSDENAVIISKRNGNIIDYELSLLGHGEETNVRFTIYSTVYHATSKSGIPAGRWTHVAGSYNGSALTVYVNGVPEGSRATSGNTRTNTGDLVIGADYTKSSRHFSGEIDEIRIWNQARSVDQIRQSMLATIPGTELHLAAYYPFSGNTNDIAGENHLTLYTGAFLTDTGIFPVPPDVFAIPGNASARLSWSDRNNTSATGVFKVYRSTALEFSDRTEVASIDPGTIEFTDTGLENGITYYYQLTAIHQNNDESDFSYPVAVTPYATGGGGSLSLDGSSYAMASNRSSLNLATPPFAIEAWLKHDGQSDEDAVIITKRDGNVIDYELRLEGSGEETALRFFIYSTTYSAVSSHGIPAGEWTHVAGVHDGTTISVYINGQLSGTRAAGFDSRSNSAPLIIGAGSSGGDQFFSGQIDELRIWSRSFTQPELQLHINRQFTGNEEHLKAYYRFDDVGAQKAYQSVSPGSLEWIGNPAIVPGGAYPLPPKIFGKLKNMRSELNWNERLNESADAFVLYRATSLEGSDRQQLEFVSGGPNAYTDTDVSLSETFFYQVTSVVGEQESDFSYPAVVTISDRPQGNALSLAGLGFARATDRPSLDMGSQSLTVEAWINYNAASDSDAIILDKSFGAQVDYRLELTGSGDARTPRFYIFSSVYSATAAEPIPPGQWFHVAGVYDGTSLNIYINGEPAGSRSTTGNTRANSGHLVIGANAIGNGSFFNGQIDEVRIWNTAKTMLEIRDNFQRTLRGDEDNLVAYFRFDETGGRVAHASDRFPKTASLLGDASFTASGFPVSAETTDPDLPARVTLYQNYPNPFNPATTIRFGLPESSNVTLSIYDALGRIVAVPVNGLPHPPGWHNVSFDAGNMSSGLYLYRLQVHNTVLTGKMMLVK